MTVFLFVSLFFILLSVVEKLLLGPIEAVSVLQFPSWLGLTVMVLLLTWFLGD